ncbi:MAG: nucleotidyltransferase family protein [Siphonobacter sp.]
MKLHIAILAAGNSSRLGQPKQLISWQGETLIKRICQTALALEEHKALITTIEVILGANTEAIQKEVEPLKVQLTYNKHWSEGMASSVRLAAQQAIKINADCLLFLLSDQPYVDTNLLNRLISAYLASGSNIVISDYGNSWGVPLLLGREYFEELLSLAGNRGARSIAQKHLPNVKKVTFPEGKIDIDTPEDLANLQKTS